LYENIFLDKIYSYTFNKYIHELLGYVLNLIHIASQGIVTSPATISQVPANASSIPNVVSIPRHVASPPTIVPKIGPPITPSVTMQVGKLIFEYLINILLCFIMYYRMQKII
jgi:uncharacterized membrane protein YqaE (UPF0057 family)